MSSEDPFQPKPSYGSCHGDADGDAAMSVQPLVTLALPYTEALAFSCFTELMKRMNQNFPHGGAMDTHFANMRSLIQVRGGQIPLKPEGKSYSWDGGLSRTESSQWRGAGSCKESLE